MGLTPLEITDNAFSASSSSDENSGTSKKSQTGLIGYTCPYVPVELLAAAGFKPYCLLHGNISLSQDGEKYVRVDACPFVKSNLAYIISNQDKFAAVVGATGCDMIRRMLDVLSEHTNLPVYILHNPRTDKPNIFNDEIDWLIKELEHLSNKKLSPEIISHEVEKWEKMRAQFRTFDKKRGTNPSLISTTDFHKALKNYYKGKIDSPTDIPENTTGKPRVYLLGSEITYESQELLDLLEKNLRIVGDFNCGLSRFLNIEINDHSIAGIKKAYYNQAIDICKRPNRGFYDHINKQFKKLACAGIIAWTLDYCDSYEFELRRMEKKFQLPILRIRSNFSFQNISQLTTRIQAFREML